MSFGPRASKAASSAAAVLVTASFVVAGCGESKYQYVKNSEQRTFVRVPQDWKLFDEDQVLQNSESSEEAKSSFKQTSWSVGFDASPKPSVSHLLSASKHPTGLVQVRELSPTERDTFSLSRLRSLLLAFDPLSEEATRTGDVEVVGARDVDPDGYQGTEFLLNLRTEEGGMIKWRQIALVDSKLSRAHVLAITCTIDCYDKNESVIEKVIDSWTVKER